MQAEVEDAVPFYGFMPIGRHRLACAVLPGEVRVIDAHEFATALNVTAVHTAATNFLDYIGARNIADEPPVAKNGGVDLTLHPYVGHDGRPAIGVDAHALVAVPMAVLFARKNGRLRSNQSGVFIASGYFLRMTLPGFIDAGAMQSLDAKTDAPADLADLLISATSPPPPPFTLNLDIKPKERPLSHVYFFQDEASGRVKIGFSFNVARRMKGIANQAGLTLRCLGVLAGQREEKEAELHERFKHHRLLGEWFSPGEDLLAYIRDNASPFAA